MEKGYFTLDIKLLEHLLILRTVTSPWPSKCWHIPWLPPRWLWTSQWDCVCAHKRTPSSTCWNRQGPKIHIQYQIVSNHESRNLTEQICHKSVFSYDQQAFSKSSWKLKPREKKECIKRVRISIQSTEYLTLKDKWFIAYYWHRVNCTDDIH